MSDAEVAYPTADSTCSYEACERPAWLLCPEGKCLYHSPSNGGSAETACLVWQTARQMAAAKDAEECDFEGWHFPPDPDLDPKGRQGGFLRATFSGDARFEDTTFSGNAWFGNATFRGDARFHLATFSADARFGGATFAANVSFGGARFAPGARIFFDKPAWGRPFRLRREGETAYRIAKQAAQERGDYAAGGYYHYAEQCAIEDRWRRASAHKPWRKAFWVWGFLLLFGRLIYGYGERPSRPLLFALAVIFLWAALFWAAAAVVPDDPALDPAARAAYQPSATECLYCSLSTFTTLGYGDYLPKEPYRLLVASESLFGAALMAVFIVCLSKKYVR